VESFGYSNFFTATACLGVPVLLLVWLASRVHTAAAGEPSAPRAEALS